MPKLTMPPRPHWKLSASARIAEKQTTMPSRTRKEIKATSFPRKREPSFEKYTGPPPSRGRRLRRFLCVSFAYIRLAEEALRTEDEDDCDRHQRHADAVVRRHDERRELAHHADDERAGKGAERAAQAAEDRGGEDADQVVRAHRRLERAVHAHQHAADGEQHAGDEPGPADDARALDAAHERERRVIRHGAHRAADGH